MSAPTRYLQVARITWQAMIAYQADTWLAAAVSGLRVLLSFLLWTAVFQDRDVVGGFSLAAMITYSLVATMIARMQNQDALAWQLANEVRQGQFSKYLAHPISVTAYFLAAGLGRWTHQLIFNLVALLVWLVAFLPWLVLPPNPLDLLWLLVLLPLGGIFMLIFNHTLGLFSLKFIDITGIMLTKSTLVEFLSGALIPLSLLPAGLVGLLRYTPFYYIVYYPASLVLGRHSEPPALAAVLLLAWTLVFIFLAEAWFRRARVYYEGVGI